MSQPASNHAEVLIIGAGMAGLMAARTLQEAGRSVLLLDKGRSVGGRLATRRIGPGRADHGAQFFTARDPVFQAWVEDWLETDLAFLWSTGWSSGSLLHNPPSGHPRYAINGGMNALAKHLAADLDVRVGVRAVAVRAQGDGWTVQDAAGTSYTGRALVMTPPVPQSLALLDGSDVSLAADDRAALAAVEYAPCVAGMFWLEGPLYLPQPGAIQRSEMPVSWVADNRRKGISPEACLVTAHAGPVISRHIWDEPDAAALAELQLGFASFLDATTTIRESQIKRWRYSQPLTPHSDRLLRAGGLPPLVFAGDGFGGPRVEGAVLSGLAAGSALA